MRNLFLLFLIIFNLPAFSQKIDIYIFNKDNSISFRGFPDSIKNLLNFGLYAGNTIIVNRVPYPEMGEKPYYFTAEIPNTATLLTVNIEKFSGPNQKLGYTSFSEAQIIKKINIYLSNRKAEIVAEYIPPYSLEELLPVLKVSMPSIPESVLKLIYSFYNNVNVPKT